MDTVAKFRIGTRKSPLALAQAQQVARLVAMAWPHLEEEGAVEIVPMMTSGDSFLDRPLSDIGGKGLFTKEIEEALLDGRIDVAVHSLKDVQTVLPDGLILACVLEREDARDRLVGQGLSSLADLPIGAVVGTASLRRRAQLRMHRPDLNVVPLRGNVQTRLKKLSEGGFQATMLAMAGLNRLDMADVPGVALAVESFIPAVCQGIIAVECRQADDDTRELLAPLSHVETEIVASCERTFLKGLDGSCRTPIAGYAEVDGEDLHFRGLWLRTDGSSHVAVKLKGSVQESASIGAEAADILREKAEKLWGTG